jgi:hypothetical protein
LENVMMEDIHSLNPAKAPEARYAYYRRCQEFHRNGKQCKAPAEKGAQVCHAHAGQKAMALRRERERLAVLVEAVAQMRQRGNPKFEMAHLFTSFKGIQVTIAVMAQALIDGRVDCKTAGRLAVDLQTMSKLLWLAHRHKGKQILPQICADERRSDTARELPGVPKLQERITEKIWAANEREETRILKAGVLRFPSRDNWANGPPEWLKAA